jgi:hypothetical protein
MKSRWSLRWGLAALALFALAGGVAATPVEDGGCFLPPRLSLLCGLVPDALAGMLAPASVTEGEPTGDPATDATGPTAGGEGTEAAPGDPSTELGPTIDPTG